MTKLTRRAALCALPALGAATAIPAVSLSAPLFSVPHPDVELIAHGAAFDAEMEVFAVANRESHRLFQAWEQACEERGLFSSPVEPRSKKLGQQTGYFAAMDVTTDSCQRLVDISERIRAIPPTTLSGLAVWARAALFESRDYETRETAFAQSDFGELQIHHLVAQIERMAGETPASV